MHSISVQMTTPPTRIIQHRCNNGETVDIDLGKVTGTRIEVQYRYGRHGKSRFRVSHYNLVIELGASSWLLQWWYRPLVISYSETLRDDTGCNRAESDEVVIRGKWQAYVHSTEKK